ncbi:DUF4166 domain-containing protein [Halobacteriales archaeon QS_8_69_26]|nr:MAG: DUF4166 domain-containing protein [Halobacteriales archaeon QS_8_69_26]
MSGLFERALGDAWDDLHPRIRDRYGVVAGDDREVVGEGEMSRLRRSTLALPALWLGTFDDFVFPESGTDVPFTITTEAFVDDEGYEALFLRRRFELARTREFVDTLRWNPHRDCVTDMFGRSGWMVSDVHLESEGDRLALSIGRQWLRVGGRYVPVPGPLAAGGTLYDWYDDEAGRFTVAAEIENPLIGTVFGYEGTFESESREVSPDRETTSRLGGVRLPDG